MKRLIIAFLMVGILACSGFSEPYKNRLNNVYVTGEVNKVKAIPFYDDMTVIDALIESEWFDEIRANKENVRLRRGQELYLIDMSKMFDIEGSLVRDIYLQPGDTIYVEKTKYAKFADWLSIRLYPITSILNQIFNIAVNATRVGN